MNLAPDKIKHIIAGIIIYGLSLIFTTPLISLAIVSAVGAGKEYIVDKFIINGTVEFMDFIATIAIPLVLTVILML